SESGRKRERIPVIRRIPSIQHLPEYTISIVVAFISALRVFIIDPRHHDDLAGCMVSKEQSVLLEEFGPEPMLVLVSQRSTLPIFRPSRILRDNLERQFRDSGQALRGIASMVPVRIFAFQCSNLLLKTFQL